MRKNPNIVLILTDDQGWGDLGRTGNTNLATPNIDALAADGAVMEWFYVQPLCAPTRAEILTGRYYTRTGVQGVTRRAERINLDERTIADVFHDAGYRTGCFGKWHSGQQYPYHPNGRGFEEFFGYCCGHWSHYFDSTIEHNGIEVKTTGYLTDVLTEKAVEFIETYRNEPFFCYVPLNTPHSPFQVPDRYFDKFREADLPLRAADPSREDIVRTRSVLAMCENIDYNVGRIVDAIARSGVCDDTIIVYLSDNGPNGHRWNGGMQGVKGVPDEGGVRSPCSITWPGHIRAGMTVHEIAGAVDLLPTLSELANVPVRATKAIDGVSLVPLLMDSGIDWPDRMLFARESAKDATSCITSVRTREFRAGGRAKGLYRLADDIGQRNDLSSSMPGMYRRLMDAITMWEKSAPVSALDTRLPVGHPEFHYTYLPAQDADASGNVHLSSIHPNASYFLDWKSVDDRISWDIDVVTGGEYTVTMMYTCRLGDEGSVIEFSCGNSVLAGTISEAFDPPLKDGCDRVKRDESYEKEFMPCALGRIWLDAGRRPLIIRARFVAGQCVADLRAIRLELHDPLLQ